MDIDRRADDESDLDNQLPAWPRSRVVLRAVGKVYRYWGRELPHRRGGHSMMAADPYLLVRAGSVYMTAALTLAIWLVRRPRARELSAALLAAVWNLPILLAVNVAAVRCGWWTFD